MKKNIIYFICVAVCLTSCSTYRSSQTPDDVYYSPSKRIVPADQYDEYQSYTSSTDDEYLRMKAADHYRWDNLDDFDYWYDSRYYYNNYYSYNNLYYNPWGISLAYNFYNPYTSFLYNPWNSVYCPAYTVVYYKNPSVYYGTRTANNYHLSTFSNRNYNNTNMPLQNGNRSDVYTNNNSSRRNDNYIINQNRNRNNSNPVRLFNNNNNNNSSNFNSGSSHNMSSGGSSGGGMSRAPRGGH